MLSLIVTGTQQIYDRLDDHDKITTEYHNKYHKKLQGQTPRHPKVFMTKVVGIYGIRSTLINFIRLCKILSICLILLMYLFAGLVSTDR